ncbi:FecCD family ABC transporter permease [Fluviispira multicolorata]|uniref:Iron chelate uptake ABC transporter family permease subunit n=1 Tax=Fluviispira multicolorata TaxID=2654512 RepID=A0A833JED0_9BACT|nr:iron ABC transporter permease [Fluviispira multicolorata]KAB8033156.1 iron chelate uptake ABC transporter family permease subunit [Fluviispira multicolorata]
MKQTHFKYSHNQYRQIIIFFISFIFLFLFIAICSLIGDAKINYISLFPNVISNYLNNSILIEYRLPRLLIGACVGANFAISGAILQAVTKNPLAAPNVTGINAGSSFFSVLSLLIFANTNFFILPLASFTGAIFAGIVVYFFANKKGITPLRLILSGVAVDAFFHSGTTFILVNNTEAVGSIYVWLSGSLWGKEWSEFLFILPCSIIGIFVSIVLSKRINILNLSDEVIIGLGLNIKKNRIILLILAVFLSSTGVCLVGPIGFIGLIIPNIMRTLFKYDYKLIIPFSALGGAFLVILSDTIGRSVLAPIEIPAGLISSLLGSPYFIYLLLKSRF